MKRYALFASVAALGGTMAYQGTFVELQPTTPGTVQSGNLNISGTAKAGTVVGYSSASSGIAYGGDFRAVSDQGRGILANASSPTGVTYGGLFQCFSTTGRGIAGISTATSGFAVGGFFTSNSPDGKAVYGVSNAASGLSYGVYGKTSSAAGYGVYSDGNMSASGVISGNGSGLTALNASNISSGTIAAARLPVPMSLSGSVGAAGVISGTNSSTTGRGVYGGSTAASGTTYGVYGESSSTSGRGVLGFVGAATGSTVGGLFTSASSTGKAVWGRATSSTGVNFGVYGDTASTDGIAVHGDATATSGNTYGGRFLSASNSGVGVSGVATASTATSNSGVFGGSNSTAGRGVYGFVGINGPTYGVYGYANATGYAVFAQGRTGASGTKSFRIDHPADPENKYLLHYSSESPTPQNFYAGNIVTDSKGYAWVELPAYFADINANFKYQLTVIGEDFAQAIVSKEIRDNRFQIRTSAPRVKVSWRVEADRNDRWVQRYGAPTEVNKEGVEVGTYQRPELYGKPAEMGIERHPEKRAEIPSPSASKR
ncbi:MAG: hypothetical protein ABL949_15585 [Fimbriimonadaceae bacterium]